MMEIVFKIWYLVAILPFIIFLEGSSKFAVFLKKKGIYAYWDVFHSYIVILIILGVILWLQGYR